MTCTAAVMPSTLRSDYLLVQARLEAMQDAAIHKAWAVKARAQALLADARMPPRMEAAMQVRVEVHLLALKALCKFTTPGLK